MLIPSWKLLHLFAMLQSGTEAKIGRSCGPGDKTGAQSVGYRIATIYTQLHNSKDKELTTKACPQADWSHQVHFQKPFLPSFLWRRESSFPLSRSLLSYRIVFLGVSHPWQGLILLHWAASQWLTHLAASKHQAGLSSLKHNFYTCIAETDGEKHHNWKSCYIQIPEQHA